MALRAVPDHPKFSELKARLKRPKCVALGCLEALWHFTGRFTPRGNIGKYTDQAIEAWVEWDGEPGALIAALIVTGWLDVDPVHRLLVHDWAQHADNATKLAVKRAKNSFCYHSVATVSPQGNDTEKQNVTQSRLPEPVPEPVPVPVPEPEPEPESKATACAAASATPKEKVPVPDKFHTIRFMASEGPLSLLVAGTADDVSSDEQNQPLWLPAITGEGVAILKKQCRAWAAAYPAVNVLVEIKRARAWLDANPRNRKTVNGIAKFMVNWLSRAQNQAPRQSSLPAGVGPDGLRTRVDNTPPMSEEEILETRKRIEAKQEESMRNNAARMGMTLEEYKAKEFQRRRR